MITKDLISTAPNSPGVYLMLDGKSSVLYVGKAKNLLKRLSSYLRLKNEGHNKTTVMLQQVKKVDTIITRTEKEALILEASLIKKHSPKYNIILRDDKNYPYIKVTTNEEWPRVMMVRRKSKDAARYFGPYSSSSAMWSTLKTISKLFPLRRCKGSKLKPRNRPCLNHQMGQCLAPCFGKADHNSYMDNVAKVIMILEGRNKDLILELRRQMQTYSESLQYEKAAKKRDQIQALSRTLEKQIVASDSRIDQDVIGFARKDVSVAISILILRSGLITGSRNYFLADPFGDDKAILGQILHQFYYHPESIPKEILLPFSFPDMHLYQERFSDLRGKKVHLLIPQRGDKSQLLHMAEKNAQQIFEEKEKKKENWETLSAALIKKLKLFKVPETIECLDISNIGGKQAVGSLVCFHKGEPQKDRYRHYSIQTVDGPDDYAMMAEVLNRRFKKGQEEKNLPDLFMVDGGKGQLGIALRLADEFSIENGIELLGIAKEKQEEGEKVYKPGRKNPILLAAHDPVLLYLMKIRDETHRFGITFHRKLRNKKTLSSELNSINGIGSARRKLLLKSLGSIKRVRDASLHELKNISGIGDELAFHIYSHFHPEEKGSKD